MIPAKYWSPTKKLMVLGAMAGGKSVEDTATGNPLTFQTDLAKPLKSLLVPFLPIQSGSGDPSPQNVRSIIPWNGLKVWNGGKNLLDKTNVINANFSTSGGKTVISKNDNSRIVWMPCRPNTTYTCSKMAGGQRFSIYYSEEEPTINTEVYTTGSTGSFSVRKLTTSSNAKYLCMFVWLATADTEIAAQNMIDSVMVEAGDVTPSAYEPYTPITETDIVFPSTVYGGTLDVVSGVLTVEWWAITPKWKDRWYGQQLTNTERRVFEIPSGIAVQASNYYNSNKSEIMCNRAGWLWSFSDDSIHFYTGQDQGKNVAIVFLPIGTDEETEIQICGSLATPQEITLTPEQITAIKGNNTIWSDANGDLTAVYLKKA